MPAPSDALAVSIIMPVCNEAGHIDAVLESVVRQAPPDDGFEIIVADGMSDDGTRAILEEAQHRYANLRVIDNPARVTPAGLNAAIRQARGKIIIRLDAHTEYAPDYVAQCLAVLRETGADNVGGPWVACGERYLARAVAAAFQSPFAMGGARGHNPRYTGPVDTVYLGCWPVSTFERFGLFDENLVRNQDDEHNLRIRRGGGKVWQSERILSFYTPRPSLQAVFRQYRQYGYWKVRVIRKHCLPAALRHLVPGAFVAWLTVCTLAAPFSLWARLLDLAALVPYVLALLAASVHTAARSEWRLAPVLPLVFMAYHFGYGIGFVCGFFDFVVLGRSTGRAGAVVLTRPQPHGQ